MLYQGVWRATNWPQGEDDWGADEQIHEELYAQSEERTVASSFCQEGKLIVYKVVLVNNIDYQDY